MDIDAETHSQTLSGAQRKLCKGRGEHLLLCLDKSRQLGEQGPKAVNRVKNSPQSRVRGPT